MLTTTFTLQTYITTYRDVPQCWTSTAHTKRKSATIHRSQSRLTATGGAPANSGTSVNYYAREQWDETGEIPDHKELKAEVKDHPKYDGLHSQSSQRVLDTVVRD
jgi:putative transposase